MAARKRNWQTDGTREKIQTTKLVQRLQGFVLGEIDPQTKEPIRMTPAQVKSAQILINKRLPDLSSSEIVESDDIDPKEMYEKLVKLLGKDKAEMIVPREIREKAESKPN